MTDLRKALTPEVTPEVTTDVTGEVTGDVDAVNISQKRVDETAKREHDRAVELAQAYERGWNAALAQPEQEPFIYVREDNERPFGGYEHCSEADAGAFPLYTAPPKREWVGLTVEEARKFYEKYTDREELIYAIDKFLEEKNT